MNSSPQTEGYRQMTQISVLSYWCKWTYLHFWQVTSDWSPPVNIWSMIQLHITWGFCPPWLSTLAPFVPETHRKYYSKGVTWRTHDQWCSYTLHVCFVFLDLVHAPLLAFENIKFAVSMQTFSFRAFMLTKIFLTHWTFGPVDSHLSLHRTTYYQTEQYNFKYDALIQCLPVQT